MGLWLTESCFVQNFHPDIFRRSLSGAGERSEPQPHFSSPRSGASVTLDPIFTFNGFLRDHQFPFNPETFGKQAIFIWFYSLSRLYILIDGVLETQIIMVPFSF